MNIKKILSIGIVAIFVLGSMNYLINNTSAVPQEVPLDYDFIYSIVEGLAGHTFPEYPKGREYGTQGEREAAEFLIGKWVEMGYSPETIILDPLMIPGSNLSHKHEFGIDDYELYISSYNNGEEVNKKEYQPLPCFKNGYKSIDKTYKVYVTPNQWYVDYLNTLKIVEFITPPYSFSLTEYVFDYTLLNGAKLFEGALIFVDDYQTFTNPATDTGVHLVEMGKGTTDEVFFEKIETILEYNGSGCVLITDNPSFLAATEIELPGIAISTYDGNRIKKLLSEYDNVHIEVGEKLEVYPYNNNAEDIIYFISLGALKGLDQQTNLDDGRGFDLIKYCYLRSLASPLRPKMDAFIFCDFIHDEATHNMARGSVVAFDREKPENAKLKPAIDRPGILLSGQIGLNIQKNDEVHFILNAGDDPVHVESYNVIGTIQGSSNNNDVVIISGHYDSYWSECPIDNGNSVGVVWGIAKYFKDNNIVPKTTIKCIAWGGEEFGLIGSKHYVWKYIVSKPPNEKQNVLMIINMDPIAMDVPGIPFTPTVYTENDKDYDDIMNAMNVDKYRADSGVQYYEDPVTFGRRGVFKFSDTQSFDKICKLGKPLAKNIIQIERWPYHIPGMYDMLAKWGDHRDGDGVGDTLNKVNRRDLNATADLVLRLTIYAAVTANVGLVSDPVFTPQDLDANGYSDSVAISFEVGTDITCWGRVEAGIYLEGEPQGKISILDLSDLKQDQVNSGIVTVTLPPDKSSDAFEIRLLLIDHQGNEVACFNDTIALQPYVNPIADFDYTECSWNKRAFSFNDLSITSPGEIIQSWNWSFGDGHYSTQENCYHSFEDIGTYNVTLKVLDSANKTAEKTIQITAKNTKPYPTIELESRIFSTGSTIPFTSDSIDVDGSIVDWRWSFGDGNVGFGENVDYSYNESGFYQVMLHVFDDSGSWSSVLLEEDIIIADALVDDDFIDDPLFHRWNSIQKGIDDAGPGGLVYVFNGTYEEFRIEAPVLLYGESKDGVIVHSEDRVVDIQGNGSILKSLTITGGSIGISVSRASGITIDDCHVYGNADANILLDGGMDCSITNCIIDDGLIGVKMINGSEGNVMRGCQIENAVYGVHIAQSSWNWVGSPSVTQPYPGDCTFRYCEYSILVEDSHNNSIIGCDIDCTPFEGLFLATTGIYISGSVDNVISTCKIYNATSRAIHLVSANRNHIEFCRITNNPYGVDFVSSSSNLIAQNRFDNNTNFAIQIPLQSTMNHIYYNDFFDNGNPLNPQCSDAFMGRGESQDANLWSKAGNKTLTLRGPGEGNYWSDYTGVDNNEDGVGDTPYTLYLNRTQDLYPLMVPYWWCSGDCWA